MIGAPCVVNGKMSILRSDILYRVRVHAAWTRRPTNRLGELGPRSSELAAGYVTCNVVRFETATKRAKGQATLRPYPRGLLKLLSSVNRGIAIEQIARMACPQRGHFGGATGRGRLAVPEASKLVKVETLRCLLAVAEFAF